MLIFKFRPFRILFLATFAVVVAPLSSMSAQGGNAGVDLEKLRSALIPKREVGADVFLTENPTYDGRGVIMAVFDTGVDPAAPGLAVTTTGERKVLDIIDGTGAGDVDTSKTVELSEDGTLPGLTGLTLTLPEDLTNPSGEFRLGMKPAAELFPGYVVRRLQAQVNEEWAAEIALLKHAEERIEQTELAAAKSISPDDRDLAQRNLIALDDAKQALDAAYASSGPGLVYDCVLWHDGTNWQVIVDANRNGDLGDDKQLRPYGIAGEYGVFDPYSNATYGVQVYEEGDLLSIVTMSGSHGTHVAAIAAAHYPDDPARNGVAPGAQVISVNIGDVRVGGGAYGVGERRAVAAAAKYGVDVVNISFGGSSLYQDGTDHFSEGFKMMVERYDILTIMSAGNEGPGLSTAGTAGGEADMILGVGAHASAEMSKVLYNAIEEAPDAALQFSSRGPTKDGDIGIDIMGPGAAWASLSAETLSATDMFNGTSMSAPSVSGVAALVMSAAKQNGMDPRPALMRNALMVGTTPIDAEAVFTTGAGMANVSGAWEKLQLLQDEPAFDVFWDRSVTGGSFVDSGRGLYLREPVGELRRQVRAIVAPHWPESSSNDERYRFEEDLVLRAADSWVDAPSYMHVANENHYLTVKMDIPEMTAREREQGGLVTSRVDALIAGKEELGAVFSLPITIVRPADPGVFVDGRLETSITLNPAVTARRFYEVPAGMHKLQIKAKHTAEDPVARRFFLQVITPAAKTPQYGYKSEAVAWMEEGEERFIEVDVRPGGVTELAFNQYFYSAEESTLELELEWLGVGLSENTVAMEPGIGFTPVDLMPPAKRDIGVSASLEYAVLTHLPTTTTEYYSDERSERPPSPRQPNAEQDLHLRLEYQVKFEEPVKAAIGSRSYHDYSDAYTGGRLKVVHESGEVLLNGYSDEPFEFPKGSTTIMSEHSTSLEVDLEVLKTLPLRLLMPLSPAQSVPVYAEHRDTLHGGRSDSLGLYGDRQETLYLANTIADDLGELKPKPDYLRGTLTFTDSEDRDIMETGLVYMIGPAPGEITDQDPESKPADDLKSPTETFDDSIYEMQLSYVREHRLSVDPVMAPRRRELLDALEAARPEDPAPLIERAIEGAILAGLASDFWGKLPEKEPESSDDEATEEGAEESADPKEPDFEKTVPLEEQILAWLAEAETRSVPNEVSRFFGAKPVALPGDLTARDEIAAEEKTWSEKRDALATINRLRVDIHRAQGRLEDAWGSWAELKRWEPSEAEDSTKLGSILYAAAGYEGLALEALNKRIGEDPFNAELLQERIALYRKLGWERHAKAEERMLAVRAANLARINLL